MARLILLSFALSVPLTLWSQSNASTPPPSPDTSNSPQLAAGVASPSSPSAKTISPAVVQGLLIHKVRPDYPENARMAGIQGPVVMKAIIGKDGKVRNLEVVSGPAPLRSAALAAVEPWRYKPYYVNGEPMDVASTITVNFRLGH